MIIDHSGISFPFCRDSMESISNLFVSYELVFLCGIGSSSGWVGIWFFLVTMGFFEFFLSLDGSAKSMDDFVMIRHNIV